MIYCFVLNCLGLAYIMELWFNTNVSIEYAKSLNLKRYSITINEYLKIKDQGYEGSYLDFLKEYYNEEFWVRLVSCSTCLVFWLNFISLVILSILFLNMGILVIFLFPSSFSTLLLYRILNKLM